MKILIIEDNQKIADATAEILRDNNYLVEIAFDGKIGWELAQTMTYDLIILDLMLPKIDGITICQKLRKINGQSLILMLTAKDTNLDQVTGLDAGADDYIIKPFDLTLLLARIRALLRRNQSNLPPILTWENLSLDPSKCEVKYQDKLMDLTPKEYHLLELFLRNGDHILTKGMIIERIWSLEEIPLEETVKVHIKGLRNKLKLVGGNPNLIENIYGLGYRLNPNF
jgi:DNA-binding response OmpR family regulator